MKMCSQRFYLLKLLRDQGMPKKHLNTVLKMLLLRLDYNMHCQCGVVIYLLNLLGRSTRYLNEPINMVIRANCIPLKILHLRLISHYLIRY